MAVVGIAGVVVVFVSVLSIAAGLLGGDGRIRVAEPRARDAERRRQRDDERPGRERRRHHQAGARHPPRRPDAAGLGRALRDHRPAEEGHARQAGERADAGHRARRDGGAPGTVDRPGPHVRVRHQRGDRRTRRQRAVRRPRCWRHDRVRPEPLERGGCVRGGRLGRRDRGLDRCARAAGRLSARQHVSVAARAARLGRRLHDVPRLVDGEPAAERPDPARERVLRRAIAGADRRSFGRSAMALPG